MNGGTNKPSDVEPDEESNTGSVIIIIILLLVVIAGIGWYVKWRKDNGMPLNPFVKAETYSHNYSEAS
jgi:uncharacterized protein YxeA